MKCHKFKDTNTLNIEFASELKRIIVEAIDLRGEAYLVVSGGKTPVGLFKCLALTSLPWDKVTITLADERCVSTSSADSNEHLVKAYLLQDKAKHAKWIGLYNDDQSATQLQNLEQKITALPVFDAVVLGLGDDGHTASLFPGSDELALGLNDEAPAVLLVNPKTAPYQRISLSKKRLLQSRVIFLHITGEAKYAVLDKAIADNNPMRFPISAFLNAPDVQVMYAPA
jgi:6-phosphogluconolactonase